MNSLSTTAINRRYLFTIACALCALATGCRNDPYLDSHIEILNAEKRALEDQLYELEYDYERKVAELEETKERLSRVDSNESNDSLPRGNNSAPRIELPEADGEFLDLSPPSVTPGVPDSPAIELPEPSARGRSTRREFDTQPVSTGPTLLEPADPRITHVHINPQQTGGSEFDPKPGDDGILLVVEPRNRSEAFVPLAGPLTVVVLDYAKRDAGDEARIARWELTAKQVDQSLRNNSTQRGIFLRLPWGEDRPKSSRLMVAVRYSTADGRVLEATRDIFITLPGQLSQRWTPRSSTESDSDDQRDSRNIARKPSATEGVGTTSEPTADGPTWRPFR
jgi:hypothetical protein